MVVDRARAVAVAALTGAVAVAVSVSCGSEGAHVAVSDPRISTDEAREVLFGALRGRWERSDGTRLFVTLDDLLPNRGPAVTERPISERAVVATVDKVTEGRGYLMPSEGEPVPVDYDDPRADRRTVHVRVTPLEDLSGGVPGDPLVVGLVTEVPPDVMELALSSLGQVVLFLAGPSRALPGEPGVAALAAEGVLPVVAADGRLSLPALEGDVRGRQEAAALLAGSETLEELRAAAREPG